MVMNLLRKVFFSLVFLLVGSFFLLNPVVISAKDFSVDLHTTYQVEDDGNTKVSHNFKIKNLNPTLFIKQYGLKLSSSEIGNVVTRDNTGEEISTEVVSTNNLTNIGITFPDQVVGQNKSRDFTITYTNPDVAIISGQVLEVSIPQQAKPEEFDNHKVEIITPLAFGLPTRAKPDNFTTNLGTDSKNIVTTFSDLKGESASLLFGNNQIFDINLKYSLENPNNISTITQIALPPDTPYQKVNYQSLEPIPNKIESDADGNWIATYKLEPNSAVVVNANALIKVTLDPDYSIPFVQPDENLTKAQKYWPVDNGSIQDIISNLNTTKDAYDYVVNNLSYDFENLSANVTRNGALGALKEPEAALCQEFSDLFITLSRAQGTPARRITGYSHTQNEILRPLSFVDDILHAWPEYFDQTKRVWVPVDPTWENTSGGVDYFNQFDLNHIVFAINGQSSELPYPAGSYRQQGDEEIKTIEVSFTNQFLSVAPDFEFKITDNNFFGWPIPRSTNLYVFNRTGQAHYDLNMTIFPEDGQTMISLPNDYIISSILPFEKKEVKINAYAKGFFWPRQDYLNISYDESTARIPIVVVPEFYTRFEDPVFTIAVGAGLVTVTLITGSLLVLIQRWRSSLRRES